MVTRKFDQARSVAWPYIGPKSPPRRVVKAKQLALWVHSYTHSLDLDAVEVRQERGKMNTYYMTDARLLLFCRIPCAAPTHYHFISTCY